MISSFFPSHRVLRGIGSVRKRTVTRIGKRVLLSLISPLCAAEAANREFAANLKVIDSRERPPVSYTGRLLLKEDRLQLDTEDMAGFPSELRYHADSRQVIWINHQDRTLSVLDENRLRQFSQKLNTAQDLFNEFRDRLEGRKQNQGNLTLSKQENTVHIYGRNASVYRGVMDGEVVSELLGIPWADTKVLSRTFRALRQAMTGMDLYSLALQKAGVLDLPILHLDLASRLPDMPLAVTTLSDGRKIFQLFLSPPQPVPPGTISTGLPEGYTRISLLELGR